MHKPTTLLTILILLTLLSAAAISAAVYGQSNSCTTTLSGNGVTTGTWTDDCQSEQRRDSYAKFYTFNQSASSQVTITLESSDADTYLYLRSGNSTSGDFLYENDDFPDASRSQIQETLAPGTYTIEATTFLTEQTGNFTITIQGLAATPPGTALPPPTQVPTLAPTPGPTGESLSQMIERVRPSTVKIFNRNRQGSGVIFRTEGTHAYIITNEHVVRHAAEVQVIVGDTTPYPATVIGVDAARDLAVLRAICATCRSIGFADSTNLNVGDQMIAMGYPLADLQPAAITGPERVIIPGQATITLGIISAFRYDTASDTEIIQTDAPINPGNSGGPLLTRSGLIAGINTFIIRNSEGLGYAVSESTIQAQLPILMSGNSAPTVTEPQPVASYDLLITPLSGHIHHDPSNSWMESLFTGVSTSEGIAADAIFINPYDGDDHAFSHGFKLLRSGLDTLYFYVHSDGNWYLERWTDNLGWTTLQNGRTHNLWTADQNHNRLTFLYLDGEVMLSLNGDALVNQHEHDIFYVPAHDDWVHLDLVAGPASNTERNGAITGFYALEIYDVYLTAYSNPRNILKSIQQDGSDSPPARSHSSHPHNHRP